MAVQQQTRRTTIRNLIIFAVGIAVLPWLGWGLDVQGNNNPHDPQASLGWFFFLVSPLIVSLLLRTFAGDGWKDFGLKPAFKGNGRWYVFSLLFQPMGSVLILVIGLGTGLISIPDLSAARLALVGQAILLAMIPSFLKNIFEEFGWRGYLAPKMQSVVDRPLIGHVLVGLVWFSWHLPYYLVLLSPSDLQNSVSLSLSVFMPLGLAMTVASSIVYGEIRLRTHSVWPAVLMHVTGNIFFDALVAQRFFSISSGMTEAFLSPGLFGISGIVFYTVTSLWLYRRRMNSLRAAVLPPTGRPRAIDSAVSSS